MAVTRNRECTECSRAFRGDRLKCPRCTNTERECVTCGKSFRGHNDRCYTCRTPERECVTCGKSFRGHDGLQCGTCRAVRRPCPGCGQTYRGRSLVCSKCLKTERQCAACGCDFQGDTTLCSGCRTAALPQDVRTARNRAQLNARRARKLAAQIAGPVPAAVYAAVLASGPCVYCGAPATTADHVRPLARGGYEAADNLVPACLPCNSSKSDRLLIEWWPDRVAHAVACSLIVADEYARQLGEMVLSERQMVGAS
jgi:hypothetical protein